MSGSLLAAAGGRPGRRAALQGLASVAVTSAVVNRGVKPLGAARRRTVRGAGVPWIDRCGCPRRCRSRRAFRVGIRVRHGRREPLAPVAVPLHGLAGVVAYSRVHTAVHYPGDVVIGSMLGTVSPS